MTEVLPVPVYTEGYYRPSTSNRRRSSQPSYSNSPSSSPLSIPRLHLNSKQFDPTQVYVPSQPPTKSHSSFISRVPILQQPVRGQFFLGDVYDDMADEELDFPLFDYAETITPTASPNMEEAPSPCSNSSITTSATSSNSSITSSSTVSVAQESPEPIIYSALDDNTIKPEPTRHVDYLSHEWKEEEIWASWRYMVSKRDVYQNSARLENASWRTWAKCKYKLKTVSPEKLNWLKDCDVTWLYGPLSSGNKVSVVASPTSPQGSPQRIQSSDPNIKKPILKKRSMSEIMLQRSLSSSSLLQQAAEAIQSQQSERRPKTSRPILAARAHSDFSTYPLTYIRDSQVNTQNLPSALSSGYHSPSYQKHIHFNNRVEQCIAVDKTDDDHDEDEYEFGLDCDDDSSEDGLEIPTKYRGSSRSSTRGSFSEHQTIAMLPSTTLKSIDDCEPKQSLSRGIVSFISNSIAAAGSKAVGSGSTDSSAQVQSNFLVDEDDEDMDWQPSAFPNRRDSIATARPKLDAQSGDKTGSGTDSDEEGEVAGLFGRAVDAVNTARDIAHVLWNLAQSFSHSHRVSSLDEQGDGRT